MPSTIGTIRTRGFLVMYVSEVCGGRLNSKFSSSVAAITCISMMLKDKIRGAVQIGMTGNVRKPPTETTTNSSRCANAQHASVLTQYLVPALTEIWATT